MGDCMTKEELAHYRMDELKSRLNGFPLGIMLVGPTGAGKSSTINALLQNNEAAVGYGTDPKTKKTKAYKFNNYIKIWDTPGLGDSPEEDAEHVKKINSLLRRTYKKDEVACGKSIDLVLVIIDGSGRDIGTVLNIVRHHIMPNINRSNILFAVNQADMAMKGRHFNQEEAVPDETLQNFLDHQAEAIRQRILESTGLMIRKPVVFSAEYGFNVHGLLDSIIDNDKWVLRKGYGIIERPKRSLKKKGKKVSSRKRKTRQSFDDEEDDYFDSCSYDNPIEDFFDGIADFFSDLFG